MVDFKENDFISLDYDLYANDKLVQSTDKTKIEQNNLQVKESGPTTIILGKGFVLKALDDDIIKGKGKNNKLDLAKEKAYGNRQKELIKTFTKRAFDEQKLRAVPGMVYDFNGTYGTVKSVVGGRVMVDFNNPLAGKNIKLEYLNVKKINDISIKVSVVFETFLKIPKNMFEVSSKDKNLTIKIPEQLIIMKDKLLKSFEEIIPGFKDYKTKFEVLKVKN